MESSVKNNEAGHGYVTHVQEEHRIPFRTLTIHRGKTTTEKPARKQLLVGIIDSEGPKGIGYLETETRTCTPTAPDLSPLKGTEAYKAHAKNIRHTHVACYTYKDPPSKPVIETLPLPDVQPTCPPQWDAETWDERIVCGTMKYHYFCSGKDLDKRFMMKVSDTRDHNGKWVYEDIHPAYRKLVVAVAETGGTVNKCMEWEDANPLDNANGEVP